MSDNYSWGRVATNSANPEVAVNDALEKADKTVHDIELRVATLEDLGGGGEEPAAELPSGGAEGQILAVHIVSGSRTLVWVDPPTAGSAYPSGGTVGQVLKITGTSPLTVGWADDAVGTGGGGGGGDASYPDNPAVGKVLKVQSVNPLVVYWATDLNEGGVDPVAFPRVEQFSNVSLAGRGGTPGALVVTQTEKGITLEEASGQTRGYWTAMRPIPSVPTVENPFSFEGKLAWTAGTGQYGIEGLYLADANGNGQIWGLNGGNSGREGVGTLSYNTGNGADWQDGEYSVSSVGSYFKVVCDGANLYFYRSADPANYGAPVRTYAVPGRGIGVPTRYGFLLHRYGTGYSDTVNWTESYSTEFPKGAPPPDPDGFLHWRLRTLVTGASGTTSTSEIVMATTAGGPSRTTGGTPFSLSQYATAGYELANAFDGNNATQWFGLTGKPPGEYIGYSFPAPISINQVRVRACLDGPEYMAQQFVIECSDDKTLWKPRGVTDVLTWAAGETKTFNIPK